MTATGAASAGLATAVVVVGHDHSVGIGVGRKRSEEVATLEPEQKAVLGQIIAAFADGARDISGLGPPTVLTSSGADGIQVGITNGQLR
jgi:hypothetical protein